MKFILILTSFISLTLNHPMMLMMALLIQTIMVSIMLGSIYMSYWFSYMVFLILVGSILILFTYMTSVASNEKFKFNSVLVSFITMFVISMVFLLKIFNNKIFTKSETLHLKESISLTKTFFFMQNFSFLSVIFFLLITMLVVVKMTKKENKFININ